ncbi:MAG: hypothetical protein K8R21_13720 [Leptospira sp.]|nr:hypothetical protein [Leptospira sp.]
MKNKSDEKKSQNERRIRRFKLHNYSDGTKIIWTEKNLTRFFELYTAGKKDHELAKVFRTTIPGVSHIARKIKLSEKILSIQKKKAVKPLIVRLCMNSEPLLRRELQSLGKPGKKKT